MRGVRDAFGGFDSPYPNRDRKEAAFPYPNRGRKGAVSLVRSLVKLSKYSNSTAEDGTFRLHTLGYRDRKYHQSACRNSQNGVFRQPVVVAVRIRCKRPDKLR